MSQLLGVSMVLAGVCLAAWPADPLMASPLAGVHPVYPAIYVFSMLLPVSICTAAELSSEHLASVYSGAACSIVRHASLEM